MDKRWIATCLAASMVLTTGCASLLEREYVVAYPHSDTPEVTGSSEALRVESYQDMVNAILYLVVEREETGTLRLYDYDMERAEMELTAACTEVSQEDALGAYTISFLQYDLANIVSYLEADITLTYRRTAQQVDEIQSVIGPIAIREVFGQGLSEFATEIVLGLDYYTGDQNELEELLQRAYYETPSAAMGMPQVEIDFYPRTGIQRIAEVTLSYDGTNELLMARQSRTLWMAEELLSDSWVVQGNELVLMMAQLVMEHGDHQTTGDTAYDMLVLGGATSEGIALAFALVCEERGVDCSVVQGTLNGEIHFWNVVSTEEGYRQIDLTTYGGEQWDDDVFRTDRQADEIGYVWNQDWVPRSGEQPVENIETLSIYG